MNSKIELLTAALNSVIQKNKEADELVDNLSVLKDFFESNPHIFHLEEYDEDYKGEKDEDKPAKFGQLQEMLINDEYIMSKRDFDECYDVDIKSCQIVRDNVW